MCIVTRLAYSFVRHISMTIKVSKVSGRLDLSQVLTELGKRGVGPLGPLGLLRSTH